MNLADRLRGVLKVPAPPAVAPTASTAPSINAVGDDLGGTWRADGPARCFVVIRRYAPSDLYGHTRVGKVAEGFARTCEEAVHLTPGVNPRPPFLFFDLETTGLSGGAGTSAFLVGCGGFSSDGSFETRQYLLTHPAVERDLLTLVDAELAQAGAMVSFNGKSFDAPVLETRYLFHRLDWRGACVPHLDVLHPARRFWGHASEGRPGAGGCSLVSLERQVLGVRRAGDVPGFEIPARYFAFLKSGNAQLLDGVLEHNRLDLLTLAGLTAQILHLLKAGGEAAGTAAEAAALGRIYTRSGLNRRACAAFTRAAALTSGGSLYIEALRALAVVARRDRRWNEAAALWRQVLDTPGCPTAIAREASEALAVHHEHRVRDFSAARGYALRGLMAGTQPKWAAAVQHRVARIDRKLEHLSSLEAARSQQASLRLET